MTRANSDQLADIWERQYEATVRSARARLRSAPLAEDVAMTAFGKLGEAMERGSVPDPDKLLRVITYGLIADIARQGPTREVPLLDNLPEPGVKGSGHVGLDFPETFDNVIRGLPKPQRDAFILTELRGLTVREAAGVLGIGRSTLSDRDLAAREQLRKELA